eukprot:scaffold1397_cov41-Attheya_sp.AAC.2
MRNGRHLSLSSIRECRKARTAFTVGLGTRTALSLDRLVAVSAITFHLAAADWVLYIYGTREHRRQERRLPLGCLPLSALLLSHCVLDEAIVFSRVHFINLDMEVCL